MQESTSRSRAASDEIDIREVFAAIGRFFSRLGNGFIGLILSLRRNTLGYKWLILALTLLGAALGFFSYTTNQPYYNSELTITSEYYSGEMLKSRVEVLDRLASERNHVQLAKKLNLTPDQASAILTFNVIPVKTTEEILEIEELVQLTATNERLTDEQREDLKERLQENINSFRISVSIYDVSVLAPLQEGLDTYLTDNEYIRRRVAIEQENLMAMRDKLRREQDRLEKLKILKAEAYSKITGAAQAGTTTLNIGPTDNDKELKIIFQEDLLFTKELQRTIEQIELNRGLEIVSSFTPYDAPAGVSQRNQTLLGALIGLGVAYLIMMLIGFNRALNRYEARHLKTP